MQGRCGLTLVEVGEGLVVQFDGRGGGGAQDVLEGQQLVLVLRGQAGLLLLEDGQSQDIAVETGSHLRQVS